MKHRIAMLLAVCITGAMHLVPSGAEDVVDNQVIIRIEDNMSRPSVEVNGAITDAHRRRFMRLFPYGDGIRMHTFSSLCKESAVIVIATVTYPENSAAVSEISRTWLHETVNIEVILAPDAYLFGHLEEDTINVTMPLISDFGGAPPKKNTRILAFLSDKSQIPFDYSILRWDYKRETANNELDAIWIMGGTRGLVQLNDDNVVDVVREYISHLQGQERDKQAYFNFLHSLLDHPNDRVNKDARQDIMDLIHRSYDLHELESVAQNVLLDGDVSWFAGLLSKIKRGELKSIPPEPSAEEIKKYRTLMQSDDQDEIREGMRVLSGYSHWYRANPDQWVDVALPLLEHPFLLIRLSIAQRLTTVGHPASVPVIIEDGLQHEDMPSRSVSQGMLQQMLGEEIDFDPRAPEEERQQQVEAFRQWWEENQHRYE